MTAYQRKLLAYFLILSFSFSVCGCGRDSSSTPLAKGISLVENKAMKPYEVCSIKGDNLVFTNATYSANIGAEEITLVKNSGSDRLSFMVPNVNAETYTITILEQGEEYSVALSIGQKTTNNEAVQNYTTVMNELRGDLNSIPVPQQASFTLILNRMDAIFQSLSAEEQIVCGQLIYSTFQVIKSQIEGTTETTTFGESDIALLNVLESTTRDLLANPLTFDYRAHLSNIKTALEALDTNSPSIRAAVAVTPGGVRKIANAVGAVVIVATAIWWAPVASAVAIGCAAVGWGMYLIAKKSIYSVPQLYNRTNQALDAVR